MRFHLPRESFIPKNKPGMMVIKAKACEAVAYSWDETDKAGKVRFYAKAFGGKRAKPDFFYYYRSAATRDAKIAQFFTDCADHKQIVAKRKEERKGPHKMEVGTVLYTSWGYDQTNIDYYQVIKIIGARMVEIRQIKARNIEDTGWMTGKSIPDIDNFWGDPMRKLVTNGAIRIASYAWAYVWDGKPKNWTAYA